MFNLEKAASAFLANMRTDGKSADTIANYSGTLADFAPFAGAGEVPPSRIAAYKNELAARGVKSSTLCAYLSRLRVFFGWCAAMGLCQKSPCIPEIMPTQKTESAPYGHLLGREAVAALLSKEKPHGVQARYFLRNRALAVLLVTSGIRNSELAALRPTDLDFDTGTITIRRGKGGKRRVVSFPPVAREAVREYLAAGIRPDVGDFAPLFGQGNPFHAFTRQALSDIVRRYVQAATGAPDIRTHALRHSCASFLLDAGIGKDDIQDLLGHSCGQVTERYLDRLRPSAPAQAANMVFNI